MKPKQQAKKHRAPWKDFLWAFFIVISLIAGFIFYISYQGDDKPIIKVADQFKADTGWTLKSERVTPPQNLCINGSGCPSVHRIWNTNKQVSLPEFELLIARTGWKLKITKKCEPPADSGGLYICRAEGEVEGYYVEVYTSTSDSRSQTHDLDLSIRLN